MRDSILQRINQSEIVNIGGVEQYLLIRGNNRNNPIVLFLHGGPGTPLSPIKTVFPKELEENFVVVHWDQRGAGNSFSESISPESMNLEQFISDSIEITNYILKEYDREKIYILGLSWGSILGINLAYRYPEKFYGYIGISQVVDMKKGEEISYDFLLKEAQKLRNMDAVSELEDIGRPPYKKTEDILIHRKWLNQLGLAERKTNSSKIYMDNCSDSEIEKIVKGIGFTASTLLNRILDYNIYSMNEIKIPVYICMGRYDYQTPCVLAEDYFNNLKAPKKEFFYFEESAHAALLEEPDRFSEILLKVLKETYK